MASTKISALTAATTLTGAESIPVVQGGVTKKVTTDQFLTKDASGNVGLGVTPSAWLSGCRSLDISAHSSFADIGGSTVVANNAYRNSGGGWVYKNTAAATVMGTDSGSFYWYTAPSGTAGNAISFTQAMTLDNVGSLCVTGGIFRAATDGGATFFAEGSQHVFRRGSSGSYAEFGRFDASGNLLVGTTSTVGRITAKAENGQSALSVTNTSGTGLYYAAIFHNNGDTFTSVGSISVTGSATSFNTSSDARLKENIAAADNGSALIDSLQVRKFDWKADGSHQRYGFVAQELDAVYPEAVSKPADPDEMMGVDYSKLVPLLVQEIQSLRARVAALETV